MFVSRWGMFVARWGMFVARWGLFVARWGIRATAILICNVTIGVVVDDTN